MNRRPSARDGVMVPRFTAAMAVVLAAGIALVGSRGYELGMWLIAAGSVGLVTALLMFWRVGHGLAIAAPLWVGLAGAIVLRVGDPGGVGGWLVAAGLLMLSTLLLVGLNLRLGAGLSLAAWLVYAGLALRAVPALHSLQAWWWLVLTAGAVVLIAVVGSVLRSRSSSRGLLRKLSHAGRETDGLASGWDAWRTASARVLRKKTTTIRPSFAELSRWRRRRVALSELGAKVACVGGVWVWSSAEEHTVTFGGPRKGKTQLLINYVLDAVGAVITTSTKADIAYVTKTQRAKRGPIYLFDPDGIYQPVAAMDVEPLAITFDPLQGCTDPAVAMDRASDLIDGVGRGGDDQGARWDGFAKQTLQALLHAAALGGRSMYDVRQWVAHPSKEAERDVVYELRTVGGASGGMTQEAIQFFNNNPNTQSSISTTIMPALSWLSVPSAAATAAPGGQQFDVAQLLADNGTVYLLGADDKKTAPLVTALTAHIARQAKKLAARAGGRLDPHLTLVLDEVALICLIPLDQWSGDFGSRGITMHIAAQSRAQLRQRFGDAATGSLLTNTATKVLFGGSGDDDDLRYWSTLAGEREEPAITRDHSTGSRSETTRRIPVLTPGQVAELRTRQVLIINNGMPPAITKARMAYKRWDLRAERFSNRRSVQAIGRRINTVEDWAGARLLTDTAWLRDQAAATVERIHGTQRAAGRAVFARLAAGLTWLEVNDPARNLVARLRLARAMRKARAALAARATDQARPVGSSRDGGRR